MKQMMLFVFIPMMIWLCACSDPVTIKDNFFGKTQEISGKVQSYDKVFTRYPFRIRQGNSTLFIMDLHGTDFFCHRFSYPGMQPLGSFAPKGSGPAEFLDAENIRFDSCGNICLLDANKSRIVILGKTDLDTLGQIKLQDKLIRTLDFDVVNDSLFVVPDYTGNHRYILINRKGKVVKSCFSIPVRENKKQSASIPLAQAWRSFLDYNSENGILAMATQLGQVLEIYDLKADSIISIFYGKEGEPVFIDKGAYAVPNGIMGYSDVHVGKEKIYAVFWGRSFKDIRNHPDVREGGNILQVFDLKGNPVRQYVLDKYITGFSVDEKNNKIIALDVNSDQPVVEYQL
ncbi:MAG: BF3164 family lipoprotein [Paludibacter sp.]|nr:BF3164 family lipoprotein [Paludibacter sp.]